VVATDMQRSVSRHTVTDGSGNFVVAALPPSVYTVRAEARGFKTVERQDVQLEVARDISLDFSLSAGEVRQEVVVTSEVPMVNTTNGTLGGTLSNKEIIDLPLNGRNYENLLTATASRSHALSRWWILHNQRERLACRRQCLPHRGPVQQ